jgi:hypothetical protein
MTTPVLPVMGDQAIEDVFDRLVSLAMQTGRFQSVNQHEPKNAPASGGPACSIWIQRIRPAKSGLAATSIVVDFDIRVYTPFTSQPFDYIEPTVWGAVNIMMAALTGDFELGGVADTRNVDLLGIQGTGLSGQAGYVEIDRRLFRVVTIDVPVIFNDAFTQEQ